jgi:hypothetical protein
LPLASAGSLDALPRSQGRDARANTLITTSWDDGNPLDLRVAELLLKYGLHGTFYVPRQADTGTMTDAQVRHLGQHFDVQPHTVHHVDLTSVDDRRAAAEVADSKRWAEDLLSRECALFCPPLGHFGPRHLAMIRSAGFAAIRTVEFFSLDRPRMDASGLRVLPTTLQAHPNGRLAYARNIAKRRGLRNLWLYAAHGGCGGDWPTVASRVLRRALAGGGVFHLWGHSWEIESAGQWASLEEVLASLGEAVRDGAAAAVSNAELLTCTTPCHA